MLNGALGVSNGCGNLDRRHEAHIGLIAWCGENDWLADLLLLCSWRISHGGRSLKLCRRDWGLHDFDDEQKEENKEYVADTGSALGHLMRSSSVNEVA